MILKLPTYLVKKISRNKAQNFTFLIVMNFQMAHKHDTIYEVNMVILGTFLKQILP